MLLVLDNYDSFTYNLVQYAGELAAGPMVYRNDAIDVNAALALQPSAIIISPGPCTPREAGISVRLVQAAAGVVPILGVCLGHQAIGEAYGGEVVRATRVMHGKTSLVEHDGCGIFEGVPSPMQVMRYHSLVVSPESLPESLEVLAHAVDDSSEVHAVRHKTHPVYGVQFHPESVMTPHGKTILQNFLELAR